MRQLFSGARRIEYFPESKKIAGFEMDKKRMDSTMHWLSQMAEFGPGHVASELNVMAFFWLGEITRHVPVDNGILRASFRVDQAKKVQLPHLKAVVGTNVPYAAKLEFGDAYIAGGQVRDWRYGDPPIYDWPAKHAEASEKTAVSVDRLGRGRNKAGRLVKSKSANHTEHMPYMRSTWPAVEKRGIDRITANLAKLMARKPNGG